MKKLVLIYILLSVHTLCAQKIVKEYGKFERNEVDMESYEKDVEAKAVILFDKGKSEFVETESGFIIRFTRHRRLKIFDRRAEEWAQFSIPYYEDGNDRTEQVKEIQASTFRKENGKIVGMKLSEDHIYEEEINKNWRLKKFVFPDVQDGSILDLKYVLETPFFFRLPEWKFQDRIPTLYSEYVVHLIPFYEYRYLAQGIKKFDFHSNEASDQIRTWGTVVESRVGNLGSGIKFQDNIHTYVLTHVPAFVDESYISSLDDYIIKIYFQLSKIHFHNGGSKDFISTWPSLNKELLKNASFKTQPFMRNSKYVKEAYSAIPGSEQLSTTELTPLLIEYVKNSFKWNGIYSKYSSQTASQLLKSKTGNSADLNLYLLRLLNGLDIDAEPVIISNRSHGKFLTDYPFDALTNQVIILIHEKKSFLTDATEILLPYNQIPSECLNEIGLIVNDSDSSSWITIEQNSPSLEIINLQLEWLPETNTIKTLVSVQSTEYDAFDHRQKFSDNTEEIKSYYEEKSGKIDRLRTSNYWDTDKPYVINFMSQYETEKIGDQVFIQPFLDLPLSKNPFTQKERSYPVDFIYPRVKELRTQIKIPENYKIAHLPEPYQLDNHLIEIKIDSKWDKNNILFYGKYYFKKAVYAPSEYDEIKNYFDEIILRFNEVIAIEKLD